MLRLTVYLYLHLCSFLILFLLYHVMFMITALSSLQRNVMMMALYSMPQISGSVDSMGHVGGFLGTISV